MKDNRTKWTQPQLIVLGRGTPEENVLGGCKTKKLAGVAAKYTGCRKQDKATRCKGANCSTVSKTS